VPYPSRELQAIPVMSASPIRHLLLDIEGTTCPVSFVSETLFPYATAHLGPFLAEHGSSETVTGLIRQVQEAWAQDPAEEAVTLLRAAAQDSDPARSVLPYLQWLIREDRKLPALKELQGLIWEAGYGSGELLGPLFEDVPAALKRWQHKGLTLSVYSSGSIRAQQLLYAHSNAGDLRACFSHWFDTRTGSKHQASSYLRICKELQSPPSQVLFISDSASELDAAAEAGLAVLHSQRGEPIATTEVDPCLHHRSVSSFENVDP
jgi:enolase-phosphatase E1